MKLFENILYLQYKFFCISWIFVDVFHLIPFLWSFFNINMFFHSLFLNGNVCCFKFVFGFYYWGQHYFNHRERMKNNDENTDSFDRYKHSDMYNLYFFVGKPWRYGCSKHIDRWGNFNTYIVRREAICIVNNYLDYNKDIRISKEQAPFLYLIYQVVYTQN